MENQNVNHRLNLFISSINTISVVGYILYFTVRKIDLEGLLAYFTLIIFSANVFFIFYNLTITIKNIDIIIKPNKKFIDLSLNLVSNMGFIILILYYI